MTNQSQQTEPSNSDINISGGVNAKAERIDIGADVVGRDKIVHISNYYAGAETVPSKPRVYHNLPQPDYEKFVGREQELRRIFELLSPGSRHFIITIDGIGGIGKSALALEAAYNYLDNFDQLAPEERFEAIIWTSAKQTLLTIDGIVQRRLALRTLDDIYTTIAFALQREDITRARPSEQSEVVRIALTQQRTLLVIDNLETVDDETVLEFLRDLPLPAKAIVTTRHRIDVAYPIRLVGMPLEDAYTLVLQECTKKNVEIDANNIRRLYDRTGGVPLAIVWSIAQMGMGYGVENVLYRLGQPTSDIARFCFQAAAEYLHDKPAYSLLMALSIFVSDTNRELLGVVTGLSEFDRDDGLALIERLSLVNRRSSGFALLPLTKVFVSGIANETVLNLYRQRALKWLSHQLTTVQHSRTKETRLKVERDNYLALIDWAFHTGYEEDAMRALKRIHWYLSSEGYWADLFHYLPLGIQVAEQRGDMNYFARFHRQLGNLYRFQGNLEQSLYHLEAAVQAASHTNEIELRIRSLRSMGMARLVNGEIDSAYAFLSKSLALIEQDSDLDVPSRMELKSDILASLCQVFLKDNRLAEALKALNDSQTAAEQSSTASLLVLINQLRGRLALLKEQADDAERYLTLGLEMSRSLGLYIDEGYSEKWLAYVALARDDRRTAAIHAAKAQEIFASLQMKDQLEEMTKLASSLLSI